MPVEFKDYYATLGVARDATDDDIKKAFRSLARRYHPDVAKDKQTAEEKFKAINEANEVLSDPVKRAKYDELGAHWNEGGRPEPPPGAPGRGARSGPGGPAPEFHFTGTGFSDFFEQFFGAGSRYGFDSGGRDFDAEAPAAERRGADVEGEILVTLMEVMHGTMRGISLRTVDPRTGQSETHSFQVRIPAGAVEGRRIRVPGKGEPGVGGAPAGDLYLRVRHAAHPDFRVRGADLSCDVDLAPWEAVLGATVVAPSFEGPIKVRIPPATNPGTKLRVRGHGLPNGQGGDRGDLYVVARIQVPPRLTEKERSLWEELGRTSPFNPREASP
jgi:curved DNA-binding protein